MGLVAWVALGYLGLLLPAGMFAAALCRVATLSARYGRSARGEVVLWGRVPPLAKQRRAALTPPRGARDAVALRRSAP
ncbi:MAG: hypothetical protein ACLQQB_10935 [Solirubrobacteraceae bacterium]